MVWPRDGRDIILLMLNERTEAMAGTRLYECNVVNQKVLLYESEAGVELLYCYRLSTNLGCKGPAPLYVKTRHRTLCLALPCEGAHLRDPRHGTHARTRASSLSSACNVCITLIPIAPIAEMKPHNQAAPASKYLCLGIQNEIRRVRGIANMRGCRSDRP